MISKKLEEAINAQIPEGTDAWTVRNGYVAIGKVNGFVL